MADATGPNLLVVGGDNKRLQWLTHHVTSHWPSAQVTTVPAGEPDSLNRLIAERAPDAVILQADFANEAGAAAVLSCMTQLLQGHPALYCIVLAENGSEMSAVRFLKGGAKDYLPLSQITRFTTRSTRAPKSKVGNAFTTKASIGFCLENSRANTNRNSSPNSNHTSPSIRRGRKSELPLAA